MTTYQNVKVKKKNIDDVIINGSLWAAIWHMAWPLLIQMSTVSIASFCDVWVAGRMGSDVQAAIGICGQIWFFMILATVALSAGTTALVSRYWGARDVDMASKAASQSMIFAFIFGTVSAIAGLAAARLLLGLLGASPAVKELGWQYMSVDMLSQLPFTIVWISHSIWRAKGNARVPMMIWILLTLVIISLDLGLCIYPFQLGIRGIGIAWVTAAVIGMILNLVLLKRTELAACVDFKGLLKSGLERSWLMRILKIGLPACATDLAWIGGCFALFLIFARTSNPTACQASWAVGFRLEEIVSCLPIHALSTAVATIVGQNLGARKPDRAEKAGWQVVMVGVLFTSLVACGLYFGATPLASLMSQDPQVIKYTADYFRIIGLSQPFLALWLILFGAMQGAGYTSWPMWASLVSLVVLKLPLCWYLTIVMGDGPTGCWLGIALSTGILGILACWRYASGTWKEQKI
ncbi:MAG: MATE family efflux transporter [Candidatus Obscuribacterales bacterium]|nr:MATE family efflux transporter [Candidatus Obscuribacterales bacterium]